MAVARSERSGRARLRPVQIRRNTSSFGVGSRAAAVAAVGIRVGSLERPVGVALAHHRADHVGEPLGIGGFDHAGVRG